MTKTLVFTDMDGTLLDHHTYSFEAAKPTLMTLAHKGIPVIPTTSKTFAELQPLREKIVNIVKVVSFSILILTGATFFYREWSFSQSRYQ